MKDSLLHTPEGVRDIYPTELRMKEAVESRMKRKLREYGYEQIATPTFEYFDIFNRERGTVPSREMYKFIDRDGETLVLRPDMTPQIARCAAKYFRTEELPIRLSYHGSTFVNYVGYQGKLKESTQLGAELVNAPEVAADAEMAALMIDCLLASGLTKFQVEIGQADVFRALAEEAGFSAEETEQLRQLIERKNLFAVEQLLYDREMDYGLKEIFRRLPSHFGSIDTVRHMKQLTQNERALTALDRLEQLYELLKVYGKESYVSFDLGMLSRYNYYTGVMFRAYTHGTGEAVAGGGRYDTLLGQFGKQAPAIGIAVYSDQLLQALERQNRLSEPEEELTLIVYEPGMLSLAIGLANQLRKDGLPLVIQERTREMAVYEAYAARILSGGILHIKTDGTIVVKDRRTGEERIWNT